MIEEICKYESICEQKECNKDECDFYDFDKTIEHLGFGAPMVDVTQIQKLYKA